MSNERTYPTEFRTMIYNNAYFNTAVNKLKTITEDELVTMNYVIPYVTKKYSIRNIKLEETYIFEPDVPETTRTLHIEDVIVFQDENGNYIQIENYGDSSIILRYIVIKDAQDSYDRFRHLFYSLENFLMASSYNIPPLYIRFNGKVVLSPRHSEDSFQNDLKLLEEEFGFTVQFKNDEQQTALLGRRYRHKAIVKL